MAQPDTSSLRTHTLPNGLTVFLREKHDAPVASFWVWYRVGSRNERPGLTGVSHWVEHMQFKGTPTIPKGGIFGEVSRHGGTLNAMTSNDWTAYFETLPSDKLDISLRIESDRMSNSLFDPAETESERTVILSERQGAENRPTYLLAEEVHGTAFQASPYRHMVIGYENDLRAITRDDLYGHYQRFYSPSNAFIAAAGDFDGDELLERITAAFGPIPAGEGASPPVANEPPQRGERRVTLRRPSPAAYLMMAYRMPGARHPDIPAILVADALLSGGKPMGMGGGSPMGRSARLYRALVSGGLARSAGSSADLSIDPNLWTFTATALPGVEPERIEAAIEAEIQRLKDAPAGEEEFAKARKQIRAQYVYSQETVTAQAFWLGQMEIVDRAARVDSLADELAAVTPEDVQRVVRTWLVPEGRTVGWQIPDDSGGGGTGATTEDAAVHDVPRRIWCLSDSGVSSHGFVRTELPNGIVVLAQPRPGDSAVDGTISIRAGQAATGEPRAGIASMTGKMLNRGTARRTFDQYNEAIDRLGAVIGVDAGRESIDVSFHSLAEDLDAVLDLSAEITLQPTFPGDELERVRQQTITGLREQESDTGAQASRLVREHLYPEGHPYRLRVAGEIETVEGFTPDDLAAYHGRAFGPNVTTVALVGGVASIDDVTDRLSRVFGDWSTSVPEPAEVAPVDGPAGTARQSTVVRGKSQADVAIAYPTLPRSLETPYVALSMANIILGQLGLMGRLGANVRDRQGLAYYAYSTIDGGRVNSVWNARAGVDPSNIERAIDGITAELVQLRSEPVSDAELADAKSYVIGSMPLGLESLGGVVSLLLTIERFGYPLNYIDLFPGIVSTLTAEQVLDSAQRYLDPDRLTIGVAGPEAVPDASEASVAGAAT